MNLKTPRTGGLALLAIVVAAAPIGFTNSYFYDVGVNAMFNAIVCVGLNLLIGYAGQISLGHAGFFALGAYGSALLTTMYNVPPIGALTISALVVGLLAFVVGRPILKLKGHYLAMATLGIGIIIHIVLKTESKFTGGPDGMSLDNFKMLGFTVMGDRMWYWVAGVLLILAVWLALNLIDSPVGRALRAVHGSEVGAEVVGVDTSSYKVLVFVVSAVFASVVGSLFAHKNGFITPDIGSFFGSVHLVTMVVLGGMASVFGAVVGAVILTLLPQVLASVEQYEAMILGVIMMGTMIFMPKGLLPSLLAKLKSREAGR
ncbi:branched-chain amino acid ABC transporter permease [Paramagnetospirillum marisnigri]|uniref:Branched-chain amino acid ABC transporter permease n=1 Tax=Paramagnetospirillum marisnigri TaxID=1285242 RepID=A0A178M7H9_9PROT|nr:branched-chain amino acid ABC transporter permease [Paramagnetospirillum marisnigri]OAN44731.1 branched-chain amino acid ABC transporter permease [Paramagnetospirillum marisnigri]